MSLKRIVAVIACSVTVATVTSTQSGVADGTSMGLVEPVAPGTIAALSVAHSPVAAKAMNWSRKRNAIAYAPLADPTDITIVGRVTSQRAWSTSKVLVVMAFLAKVAGGKPRALTPYWRSQIRAALKSSNLRSLQRLRAAIPGGSSRPMTRILRSLGDTETSPPNTGEGSMTWTLRNQVRFMAALAKGEVVSRKSSRYVLKRMRPVKSQRWGLGRIDATAFKGGWLTPTSETRQMGIVEDYAVAIITNGVGKARLQSDGDWAHTHTMNRLARKLERRLSRLTATS